MPRDIKYAKIHLIGLRPNNVDEFYIKKFNQWLLLNSSKVKFNERLIENPIERNFLMLPKNENGEPQEGVVEISGTTSKGYELYEDDFIHDELIILTPLYNEIEKTTKTELRKQLKQYIDFLNQRKEQIEKINTTKQQSISPQQLKTELSDTELNTLAVELINKGFIASTDKECFVWALGGSKKVDKFKPIEWVVAKLALRELLTPILGKISNQHIGKIKMLFTKENKPLELYKQKKDEYSRHIKDIESIIEDLNLPTTPTD